MGCAPSKSKEISSIKPNEVNKKSDTEGNNPKIILPGNSAKVESDNGLKLNPASKSFTIIGDNLVEIGGSFKLVAKAKTKSNTYELGETHFKKGAKENQVKYAFGLDKIPKEDHNDVEFRVEFHYEDENIYIYKANIKPGNKVIKKDFGVTFELGFV